MPRKVRNVANADGAKMQKLIDASPTSTSASMSASARLIRKFGCCRKSRASSWAGRDSVGRWFLKRYRRHSERENKMTGFVAFLQQSKKLHVLSQLEGFTFYNSPNCIVSLFLEGIYSKNSRLYQMLVGAFSIHSISKVRHVFYPCSLSWLQPKPHLTESEELSCIIKACYLLCGSSLATNNEG